MEIFGCFYYCKNNMSHAIMYRCVAVPANYRDNSGNFSGGQYISSICIFYISMQII